MSSTDSGTSPVVDINTTLTIVWLVLIGIGGVVMFFYYLPSNYSLFYVNGTDSSNG